MKGLLSGRRKLGSEDRGVEFLTVYSSRVDFAHFSSYSVKQS